MKEKLTDLTNSDEEKASEDEDVDDEDLVGFDEFILASQGDALISLTSHETICFLKPTAFLVVWEFRSASTNV